MRRSLVAAAVFATVAAIFLWIELPPKQQTLRPTFADGTIPGVLHIHSLRSDGRSTPEQIAHDAARAGLKFIVLTDHGDATRRPDAPVYREGVLCIDAVEISTRDGHYVALGIPAAPYPLGGDARDVVDDVRRLGGFGIVAHPDSPKPELQWSAWNTAFDGMEALNFDTMWRRRVADRRWRAKAALLTRLLTYAIRPSESIASLVLRSNVFPQWDAAAARRHVVLVAGADAHGQIAWRASDPIHARVSIPLPAYESLFRAASVRVRIDSGLTGDAKADATTLLRAIRAGHLYTAIDGIASPPAFELTATNALGSANMGDQLAAAGPVTVHVRSNAPDGFTTTVWDGTTPVAVDRREHDFTVTTTTDAGVYWAEIHADGERAAVPWITSNPVYVRATVPVTAAADRPPASASTRLFDGHTVTNWRIESDSTSVGVFDVGASLTSGNVLRLRFGLSGGSPANQFVALAVAVPGGAAANDRLTFTARAERPMRVSVQLRAGESRWARSVYVDTVDRSHTIFFDDFRNVDDSGPRAVPAAYVTTVLFVIDVTNTKPGSSGRLWITDPVFER